VRAIWNIVGKVPIDERADEEESQTVRLAVGSKVTYPSLGPCIIGGVVNKMVAGTSVSFYKLAVLDGSGGELFVPVDKAQSSGLRLLLKESEIP